MLLLLPSRHSSAHHSLLMQCESIALCAHGIPVRANAQCVSFGVSVSAMMPEGVDITAVARPFIVLRLRVLREAAVM